MYCNVCCMQLILKDTDRSDYDFECPQCDSLLGVRFKRDIGKLITLHASESWKDPVEELEKWRNLAIGLSIALIVVIIVFFLKENPEVARGLADAMVNLVQNLGSATR